ncbi:MAG: trehalose-phosphatase [Nocardioidaceae bacterium]
MEFRTAEGQARYDALVEHAAATLVGLDFDGTLAPIVDDPAAAYAHPDAPGMLIELARVVRQVVVVTGRPARQVVELAGLERVADALEGALEGAGRVEVRGQYGDQSWRSDTRRFEARPPPEGLAGFAEELPRALAAAGAADAFVEDKGVAIAVHVRRLVDARDAFDRLLGPLRALAERHGLGVEPGRLVVEIREPGMTKGRALLAAVRAAAAEAVLFIGDDLADLDAFDAVVGLRRHGIPGLLVCSGSDEQRALVDLADLVVDGPAGVVTFLRTLAAAAASPTSPT